MVQNSKTNFIKREVYPRLLDWLEEPEILALAGPRQSGKTTLLLKLKQELKGQKVIYVNFEDTAQLAAFTRSPRDFISLQLSKTKKTYFLFDEFQYVENAGKSLKLLYDEIPQAKFIITGSSSLKIRQIASYLVGRVIFFNLYPLSFAEFLRSQDIKLFSLWEKFNQSLKDHLLGKKITLPSLLFEEKLKYLLEEYLIYGGYPAVATSKIGKKQPRLTSLIETYIEKDIVKLLRVGNFLEFRNFASVISSQTANLLSYSSLSRDTRLSFREVKKFLAILEKTFVIRLLKPYFSNRISEIRKSPKVYFLDLGLRNALINDFREVDLRQDKGALVENFVLSNFTYRLETEKLNFWRTKQGAEVDFILNFQNEIVPIEVKYSKFTQPKLTRSTVGFIKNYHPQKAIVLTKDYVGLTKVQKTNVLFFPIYFV